MLCYTSICEQLQFRAAFLFLLILTEGKRDYMTKFKTGAMPNMGYLKKAVKVYLADALFFLKHFWFSLQSSMGFPPASFALHQAGSGCAGSAGALCCVSSGGGSVFLAKLALP